MTRVERIRANLAELVTPTITRDDVLFLLAIVDATKKWLPEISREGDQFDSDAMRDCASELRSLMPEEDPFP